MGSAKPADEFISSEHYDKDSVDLPVKFNGALNISIANIAAYRLQEKCGGKMPQLLVTCPAAIHAEDRMVVKAAAQIILPVRYIKT